MPRCYPASLSSGGRPETIPFHAGHRFRANPKKCPTCRRNGCPTSSGTGVQHVPEWVSSMVRNTHLRQPITRTSLYSTLSTREKTISSDDISATLDVLQERGMIQTGTSDCFETSRYDRHHIYYSMFSKNPWHCQDRLKNS